QGREDRAVQVPRQRLDGDRRARRRHRRTPNWADDDRAFRLDGLARRASRLALRRAEQERGGGGLGLERADAAARQTHRGERRGPRSRGERAARVAFPVVFLGGSIGWIEGRRASMSTQATHYDVIIIGSGAGGGTLARHLAPSGKRILVLERGDWLPREQ